MAYGQRSTTYMPGQRIGAGWLGGAPTTQGSARMSYPFGMANTGINYNPMPAATPYNPVPMGSVMGAWGPTMGASSSPSYGPSPATGMGGWSPVNLGQLGIAPPSVNLGPLGVSAASIPSPVSMGGQPMGQPPAPPGPPAWTPDQYGRQAAIFRGITQRYGIPLPTDQAGIDALRTPGSWPVRSGISTSPGTQQRMQPTQPQQQMPQPMYQPPLQQAYQPAYQPQMQQSYQPQQYGQWHTTSYSMPPMTYQSVSLGPTSRFALPPQYQSQMSRSGQWL